MTSLAKMGGVMLRRDVLCCLTFLVHPFPSVLVQSSARLNSFRIETGKAMHFVEMPALSVAADIFDADGQEPSVVVAKQKLNTSTIQAQGEHKTSLRRASGNQRKLAENHVSVRLQISNSSSHVYCLHQGMPKPRFPSNACAACDWSG